MRIELRATESELALRKKLLTASGQSDFDQLIEQAFYEAALIKNGKGSLEGRSMLLEFVLTGVYWVPIMTTQDSRCIPGTFGRRVVGNRIAKPASPKDAW